MHVLMVEATGEHANSAQRGLPQRDSNPGPCHCEAAMLTTVPLCCNHTCSPLADLSEGSVSGLQWFGPQELLEKQRQMLSLKQKMTWQSMYDQKKPKTVNIIFQAITI